MKLFYITSSYPYGIGESFLMPEIEALKIEGAEIIVVPIFPRGKLRTDHEIFSSCFTTYTKKLFSASILFCLLKFICIHPVKFFNLLLLIKGSTFSQIAKNIAVIPKSIWLKSLIEKDKPDHIHVHWGGTTSTAVMLAVHCTSISWSMTCHRWDIYENNLLVMKSQKSNFIRFISEKGRADALKLGISSEKSFVIHMGTKIPDKPTFLEWRNNGKEFKIICPANLIPVKGHIYLFEAIKMLVKEKYRVTVFLAGEGNMKEELKNYVHKNGLEEIIVFLGQLTHQELLKLYEQANVHLMVLPSVDLGNGEHEGIPVSLMEAMSYGIPVISTDTGSINELLPKDYGLTVPDKNVILLTQKIKFLYNNPDEHLMLSLLCRKIIEKDWDVNLSARKLIAMIKSENYK